MFSKPPFYVNDMHNSTLYENHRYFGKSRLKTEESRKYHRGLREFVQVPQPFGINHTYQYLRKSNLQQLPEMTRTNRFVSVRHSRLQNSQSVRHSTGAFRTGNDLSPAKKHFRSISQQPRNNMPITIILYDRLSLLKHTHIELDLMNYLRGCFLKCELKLEQMTPDQFRILSEYIPAALASRRIINADSKYIPIAELGLKTIRTMPEMMNRFMGFRDSNKIQEVIRMLNHYILPEDDVLDYQLGLLLNDLNIIASKQINQVFDAQQYSSLHIFNGNNLTRVTNIFQLNTELPIVAAKGNVVDERIVVRYRKVLLKRMRERRVANSLLKFNEPEGLTFADRSEQYNRIDEILKKRQRQKCSYKGKVKYKNPLLDIKVQFIDRSKLVPEHLIFQ